MPGEKVKSPSTKLKAVLFLYWRQSLQKKYPQFEDYYKAQMEGITNQFKSKLISKQ